MTRPAGGFLPLSRPDRQSGDPLHLQIARQIVSAIIRGAIEPGERLPSTRALSHQIGVARNTVIAAYDELMADEWIESRRGDGVRIAGTLRRARYSPRTVAIVDPDGTPIAISF